MSSDRYLEIAGHYNGRLAVHGDTAQGADWPNQLERDTRHDVMLSLVGDPSKEAVELLDFACGTGDLLRHIGARKLTGVRYKGADISGAALRLAREKFPSAPFVEIDVLCADDDALSSLACDYCVINGLFTVKRGLSQDEMWSFMTRVVKRLWSVTRRGIAFNVMSAHVDYRRDDLFHVSYDQAAEFLHQLSGRQIAFRADYGLFEYTCFAFKDVAAPRTMVSPSASARITPLRAPASSNPDAPLEVCRPSLPRAAALQPYLEEIDARRWYSNWGELNQRLEERLAQRFRLPERSVVTASSGTDAITAALIALAGRSTSPEQVCLLPSYTFAGTAAAVMNAGYAPHFLDVDERSMALDPETIRSHPALSRAAAIIVVAPYGQPVDGARWRQVSEETGVPVIVDAAAGFDSFATGAALADSGIPVALSFHATKSFGTGEGGAILCGSEEIAIKCRRALSFGFLGDRTAVVSGFNGKLSEYHAAVGLAELDGWEQKRSAYIDVANHYLSSARRMGIGEQIIAETGWASSYVLFRASNAQMAQSVCDDLRDARIGYRVWYGHGVHRYPAYAACPADPMPVTDALAPLVIGLPVSVDLAEVEVDHIVFVVASAAGKAAAPPSSVA